MREKSLQAGTDPARGARNRAPGAKPVAKCAWSGCAHPRTAGRGHRYCEVHATDARRKSLAAARHRFRRKLGEARYAARVRTYSRTYAIRIDRLQEHDLPFDLPGPRITSLRSEDVAAAFEDLRELMHREGPVSSIRDSVLALQQDLRRELPPGKRRSQLLIEGHEILRDLGDPDPAAHQMRCRLLLSHYASLDAPAKYERLARAWLVEGDAYRKANLLDKADATLMKAQDALSMMPTPDPALRHLAIKLVMRLFLAGVARGHFWTNGEKLVAELRGIAQATGSSHHALETVRELVGYHTVLGRYSEAWKYLENLHELQRGVTNAFTHLSIIRAELELLLASTEFDALPPLLARYRALSDPFRDKFRVTLLHRWAERLGSNRDLVGPIPSWPSTYVPYLY